MPYCPRCRMEYVEGIHTCSDCGIPLVSVLPEPRTQRDLRPIREEVVGRYPTRIEAEMWAGLLTSSGIACVVVPLGPIHAMGGAEASCELRVAAENADLARELLSSEPAD